jgi:hypothetical protein
MWKSEVVKGANFENLQFSLSFSCGLWDFTRWWTTPLWKSILLFNFFWNSIISFSIFSKNWPTYVPSYICSFRWQSKLVSTSCCNWLHMKLLSIQTVEKRDVLTWQKFSLCNSQGSNDSIPKISGSLLLSNGEDDWNMSLRHWLYYDTGWNSNCWELLFLVVNVESCFNLCNKSTQFRFVELWAEEIATYWTP